ncbi:Site-specific DNA-adenine methylase [Pseudarcicella hirudinis]|uniref:Site-specific DNA-adenine methylase n=2 Tax=Pseudarcicella hirudinis TaxID=1079859 RepID=A0A1I5SZR5_9BACT|nr:hypothetical protein [Pseudarcicella hirudinis]SFP76259.1 Site-specific DNA-adenine methylase [Pseudarcicella hirudinis]
MFSYYGSKSKIIDLYPAPKHDTIIEPFAGSARYSLKYFDRDIYLYDKYDVIVRMWKFLQKCSPNDILSLPDFKQGDLVRDFNFDCIEMEWLVGFMVGKGRPIPSNKVSKWGAMRYRTDKIRIAKNLHKIKHWHIEHKQYTEIENIDAVWFIDPPYETKGFLYKHNKIDYNHLASFCKSRKGQVIVCEAQDATWLPFKSLPTNQRTSKGVSNEAIWSNEQLNLGHQCVLF